MTLEEAKALLEKDQKHLTRKPIVIPSEKVDKNQYVKLLVGIHCLVNQKGLLKSVKNYFYLRKNPLVKSLSKSSYGYKISTQLGDGCFYAFDKVIKGKKVLRCFTKGQCYSNSMKLCNGFYANGVNAVLKTGIVHSPIDKPENFIHSVCAAKSKNGEDVVLDFNYNLSMTEGLYDNLYNFETLNQIPAGKVAEDSDVIFEYARKMRAKGKTANVYSGSYALSDEGVMSYVKEKLSQENDEKEKEQKA